jgi:hypothetical protein
MPAPDLKPPFRKRHQSLSKQERISPFIRVVSGVIGFLGVAAIPLNALRDGSLQPTIVLFASLFAGFVFLYVAFFGKYPWDRTEPDD